MKPFSSKSPATGLSRAARIGTAVALTAALSLGTFAPAAVAATDNYGREVTSQSSPAQPAVIGAPYFGQTLNADPGAWNEPVSVQWLRGGKAVPNEVFYAYTVSKDDLGKPISVKVTGDYSGKTRTSGSTAKASYTPIANTKAPAVSGNPVSGSVLTASGGSWSQKGTTLKYQWLANGQAIKGAEQRTYVVAGTDKGRKLSVKVTASKNEFLPASATSAQTAAAVYPDIKTAVPRITGNPALEQKLTAVPGSWTAGAKLTYKWNREGLDVGTGPEYILSPDDKGYSLTVTVTGTKDMYISGSATSARTAEIGAAIVANSAVPTITGSAVEGRTLTASPGAWSPSASKLAFQWMRNGEPIKGATERTYKLTRDDLGSAVSIQVVGSMDGYKPTAGESAKTSKVLEPMVGGKIPLVTGTPEVSRTLTANAGTWQDGADLKYQWLANGAAISGATGETLKLGKGQIGQKITVAVTGSKDRHRDRTATSLPTGVVTDLIVVNAVAPTLAGTKMKDSYLRIANAGTWGPGSVNLKYQWLRDGKEIPGATAVKYLLVQEDVGKSMSARVTGVKPGYESASVTTKGTGHVKELTVTGDTPTIGGSVTVGRTITAKTGTWTKDAKLTYQWLRSGVPISGAGSATYKVVAADAGHPISVTVKGTRDGYVPLERTSVASHKAYRGWIEPTKTAWIHGGHMDGYTMSARDVAYNTGGASISYQWLRNGNPIPGAQGSFYVLNGNDVGQVVSLRIKATKADYRTHTVTTGGTNPVANSPILNTVKPVIVGAGHAGSVMSTSDGKWNHTGLKFSYQWYSDGKVIPGANRAAYRPTQEKTGTQLTVKITAKKSKLTTGSVVSGPTAKIK